MLAVLVINDSFLNWSVADTETSESIDSGDNKQGNLEDLDTEYDTRYVDQLTLPRVAAPLASAAKVESSTAVGRGTQRNVNPAPGANVGANAGFFPTLTIRANSRKNPARVAGGDNQTDDSIGIGLDLKYRGLINSRHIYELSASTAREDFDEFVSLDAKNTLFSAALRLDMTQKLKADLYTSYAQNDDTRGVTATRLLDPNEPNDEYEEADYGGRITIGRRTNPVQIVVGAERSNIDFTNNEQSERDREDDQFSAGLYLNVSPKTSLFLIGQQTDIDYESPLSAEFDSRNTELNLGIGWEPSYISSLLLRIGRIEKSFEDSEFEDQDTESYLGKFTWLPSDLSVLSLYVSKTYEESIDRSSPVIESVLSGMNLGHSITDSFRAQAFINFIEDDLINVRQDEITDYGIGLYYNINRWMEVGGSWSRTERDSTDPAAVYNSELFSISLTVRPRFNREFGDSEIHTGDDLRRLN
jgi:hypothetical protein